VSKMRGLDIGMIVTLMGLLASMFLSYGSVSKQVEVNTKRLDMIEGNISNINMNVSKIAEDLAYVRGKIEGRHAEYVKGEK